MSGHGTAVPHLGSQGTQGTSGNALHLYVDGTA